MKIIGSKYFFIFCLLLLYISWGSGYIVAKFALLYSPGLMLTFLRMSLAGIILIGISRAMGEKIVFTYTDFKAYSILGFFLVVVGGAFVSKGQESVSSGTTAMLLSVVPTWMVLADWYFSKIRPSLIQVFGLCIGIGAMGWMQWYQGANGQASFLGFTLILLSTVGWVYGSQLTKTIQTKTPMSLLRSTGFMMLIGGVETFLFAILVGERLNEITWAPQFLLTLFLQVVASVCGYGSYLWLLQRTRPMIAISYEFVNPVIALYLGWLIGGERVDSPLIIACILLICSAFFAVSNKNPH